MGNLRNRITLALCVFHNLIDTVNVKSKLCFRGRYTERTNTRIIMYVNCVFAERRTRKMKADINNI